MRAFVALLVLLAAAPIAKAASPEQTYLAARDHAIEVLKKMSGAKRDAEEKRLSAGLEAQLRSLVGVKKLEGFPGPTMMSPDTLMSDDEGFGALDGVRFTRKDLSGDALVSTEGLLRFWLVAHKDWWNDLANPPADPEAAFHSEAFYTQAVSADAAMSIYAVLPIRKPDGAAGAVALLGQESQDRAIEPPGQIAVAVVKNGKVFIAIVNVKAKLAPIAACDAVWQEYKAKSDKAIEAYNSSGSKDEKIFDESTKLEDEGEVAVHKCWSEKASGAPEFPALTKEAQALVDRFAAQ
ncbi:MAG TPA: hypothetical protein VKS78_12975 [Roseiarcus sp.]|nr:hypothetical protein [Roseiarcus sp.]